VESADFDDDAAAEKKREYDAEYSRTKSRSKRDIRTPSRNEPLNDERRAAGFASLRSFLDSYFPEAFNLAWSDDHLTMIDTLQHVIESGGKFALAMPRGSGKSTIVRRAAIWAMLTGRRKGIQLVSATEELSVEAMEQIREELVFNNELELDFPFELHGVWQTEGENRQSRGQLCHGKKTGIFLGRKKVVLPSHDYSPVGGSFILAVGLTGNIRGANSRKRTGAVIRPDFVILDDPQTDESAISPVQNQKRIKIVEGPVMGLAGPGKSLAVVMPCTVIAKGDVADHFLNHNQWHAIRAKLLPSFPTNLKLWEEYFEVRAEGKRVDRSDDAANAFYLEHRPALEEGAVEGWPARKEPTEITALQSAMHKWYESPTAFAAEYQNEPLDNTASEEQPTFRGLEEKLTRLPRGVAPVWATKVTMGVDVQGKLLFWVIVAWGDDFTCSVIDYGAWPEQPRSYFTLSEANPSLQVASGSSQLNGAIHWGLTALMKTKLGNGVQREGGGEMSISKAIIDANWGESTDTVYEFCRRSTFGGVVIPSHGRGLKAGDRPMSQWAKKQGETHGWHWVITPGDGRRAVRHVIFDTNHWKTTMAARAAAFLGERGTLTVYGERQEQHRLLIDHLAAERPNKTSGQGRELWEWKSAPGRDNHWLDCLSLAGVGASMLGCSLDRVINGAAPFQKKVSFSELQRLQRERKQKV